VVIEVRARHESHAVALHRPQPAGPAGEERDGGVHHRRHDGLRIERGREGPAEPGQSLESPGVER
jgi:hypothetical protein